MGTLQDSQHPATLLCRPAVLGAVVIVAINDHVLKESGWLPGIVTGKLSDVAGLFFFPILLAVLLLMAASVATRFFPTLTERFPKPTARHYIDLAVILTVIAFSTINVVEPVNTVVEYYWGVFTMDPSDLFCLPMVVIARYFALQHRWIPKDQANHHSTTMSSTAALRWPHYIAAMLAGIVSIATPAAPKTISSYPFWKVSYPIIHCRHGVEIDAWVAKSGKEGTGLVIRFANTGDKGRHIEVDRAEFLIWRDRDSPTNTTLRIESASVPPLSVDDHNSVYLPFEFDNESAWNDDLRVGKVAIAIQIDEQPASVQFDVRQQTSPWSAAYQWRGGAHYERDGEYLLDDTSSTETRICFDYKPVGGCIGERDE